MRRPIITFITGALTGGLLSAWWLHPTPPECPTLPTCEADPDELAMLQWENRMLIAMVQAGLKGDISGHLQHFTDLQTPSSASPPSPPAAHSLPEGEVADALIDRLTRADVKLQRQALAEGWATDERLTRERQALWDQARRQLSDRDYMAALHRAGRPNRLLVDTVRRDSEAGASLQHGDVIWSLDGHRVLTRAEYRDYLAQLPPKAPITLEIRRQGQVQQLTLSGLADAVSLIADSVPPPE